MKKITTKEFIIKANEVHENKYGYDKVKYVNAKNKVNLTCEEHGDFLQTPNGHLSGQGCPKCGRIKNNINIKKFYKSGRNWDFEQPEEYKLIPLTQGKFAKVDNEDFERVVQYNWYFDGRYVKNNSVGHLHRFIMNAPDHLEVDHIWHDELDNRKSELRLATRPQNKFNQILREGCSSKYKGVYLNKRVNKWVCSLMFEGVTYNLGYFSDEKDAGMAYDKKAIELQREFAYLNFPELKEEYLKEIK